NVRRLRGDLVSLSAAWTGGGGPAHCPGQGKGIAMTAAAPIEVRKADSVFKPVLLLMSGRGLAFVATFFIPVVLARIFDPGQFGTYKQLFLIYSSVFFIAQLGMATSLYYFLPTAPLDTGKYVANSLVFLGGAGLVGCAVLVMAAPQVGRSLNNGELARYLPWI